VRVYKEANFEAEDVSTNIRNALADFFAVSLDDKTPNTAIDFGSQLLGSDGLPDYTIAWSDVFNAINDTEGVRKIPAQIGSLTINGIQADLVLLSREFPVIGSITILDLDQNGIQI
jgi:hypothetical protein